MPDLPEDHPEFLAAYAKAAGVKPRPPVRSGSLAAAIETYKGTDDFMRLSAGTRAVRRRALDDIAERFWHAPVAGLETRHVAKALEGFERHAWNNRLKTWRGLGKWLVKAERIVKDPTKALKKAWTPPSAGHIPWACEEIEQFRAHWPIGSMERLAFELIYWTGARVSDAIRLGQKDVDRDGWLCFVQQKTGGDVAIPFRRALPEFAERYSADLVMLHAAIDARNERHLTWLHTQRGASRSPKSVSQWFASKVRKAGIEGRTAHGLRKARAIALAEAGGTSPQIGAWTGHESLTEIERYIRKFDKRRSLSKTEAEQKVPTPVIGFQNYTKTLGKTNG